MAVTMPWVPGGWIPVPGSTTASRAVLVMRRAAVVIGAPVLVGWSDGWTSEEDGRGGLVGGERRARDSTEVSARTPSMGWASGRSSHRGRGQPCLLYTSDAADEEDSVGLG